MQQIHREENHNKKRNDTKHIKIIRIKFHTKLINKSITKIKSNDGNYLKKFDLSEYVL